MYVNALAFIMTDDFYKYRLTIGALLKSAVRRNPNQEIAYQDKYTLSYAEFRRKVENFARSLIKLGVSKGDVVAVLDWDTDRYLIAYYAVPMIGAILHTVNIRYPPELIYYTMKDAEDKYVIIRDEFVPIIEKNAELFNFIQGWIVYSESGSFSTKLDPVYNFDTMAEDDSLQHIEIPDVEEDDVATIFFTSGTTGLPKGVTFTHRNLVLHSLMLAASISDEPMSIRATDAVMALVPMFHVHSWGFPYWVLLKGSKYVLPGRYDYGKILHLIKDHNVKISAMVPPILYLLLSEPEAATILPQCGLRAVIGGAALTEGLARKAESVGVSLISGYGLSETAPVLTLATYNKDVLGLPEEEKFKYRLKTGVPTYLVDLRVVDENMNDVPHDSKSIGEIVVRSPWLTRAYWKNEKGTQDLWRGGWLHTGDLGVVDNLGYVTLVDREKDAVKSGGEFIPSLLLEDVISTIQGINEVAVVAKQDEKWGERPVAFYSSSEALDENFIRGELMKMVDLGRISKFWIPDNFIRVETFDRTSTGKIDKKPLKERVKNL